MRSLSVVLMLTAAFAMSSCGKSLSKLTDAQKGTLSDTLASAGRARTSIPGSTQGLTSLQSRVAALGWLSSGAVSSVPTSGSADDATRASMETKIRNAKDNCAITNQPLDSSSMSSSGGMSVGSMASLKMKLKVDGAQCPVNLNLDLSGTQDSNGKSGELDFGLQYKVLDSDFAKLNDVDSMDVSGKLKASGDVSQDSASLEMSLDVSGKIHSQAKGDVKVSFSGDVSAKADHSSSSASGEVAATFEFADFTAELKQKVDGQKNTYYINGEEVSEADFKAYFQKAGVPSGVSTPSTASSAPSSSTSYGPYSR